jgi:cytochrome c biogenesis protein CcmG, thiol:disulfide interchange protein DsbE
MWASARNSSARAGSTAARREERGRCLHRLAALAATLLLLVVPSPPASASSAGDVLDLTAFNGQVVYLDFWASWCAPCRESFPWMNRLQGELGHDGLVVIAVNVDRERADADRFLREHRAQFRIVYDPDGLLPEKFGVRGMPTSFLIDRNGHVQSRHEGFLLRDRDALRQLIRALVLAR